MTVAIDMMAYREPVGGVQGVVLEAVKAELPFLRGVSCEVFANACAVGQDLPLSDSHRLNIIPGTKTPFARILWQQTALPLRTRKAEVLQALAYTAPMAARCPVILLVHDLIALEFPGVCSRRNALQMKMLLPISVKRASRCVTSTRTVADRLMQVLKVPASKIEVMPFGVGQAFVPGPSATASRRRPYFLFVGTIEPKKSLDTLLDAYSRYASKGGAAELVVIGRQGWKCGRTVQRLLHWTEAGTVRWLGRLEQGVLIDYLRGATVLVMPSFCEGFGLPLLEAMAVGTPVIHSDAPALVEVAGGAGRCFPRGDAEALARLLADCGQERLRREMSEAALKRAKAFSWQTWGRSMADLSCT